MLLLALAGSLCAGPLYAQLPDSLPLKNARDSVPRELQFIGYSFTRTTTSNIAPANDLLQGQVIGRLFGPNSTRTIDRTAFYTEQRFVPYLVYRPKILDGVAIFRYMGKVDYTWGDQSYGVGGNRGGGLSGGQVNLQTLMANVDIRPKDQPFNIVIGLQRLFDNAYDPHAITQQQAMTSGYKLSFWGTNAVGVNLFATPRPGMKARVGVFQLWENLVGGDDDVVLFMADADTRLTPRWEVGADAWYLRDRGRGGSGISVLAQGLNSPLAAYNGATQLSFPATVSAYTADLFWAGLRTAWNRDFMAGRWWADAYAIANLGVVDTIGALGGGKAADVLGVSANAALSYKYGMTANDRVSLEALFTSGDGGGISDGKTSSVITGNVYGSPVGIYSSHRALLLFPDPQVVNRYYSAVHDISNDGRGVSAGFVTLSRDLIPNRFSVKLGGATAFSNTKPTGGSNYIGSEINAEAKYNLKVFLTAGLSAGYLKLGDYYDAPSTTSSGERPDDAWVMFATLSWLMF
jgi:hypothetical protein